MLFLKGYVGHTASAALLVSCAHDLRVRLYSSLLRTTAALRVQMADR